MASDLGFDDFTCLYKFLIIWGVRIGGVFDGVMLRVKEMWADAS